MTELALTGHDLKLKDLYAEKFDPVLSEDDLAIIHDGKIPARIQKEQEALSWAEGLVFIYPLWWYATPAILKGWFDCVLNYGYAFTHHNGELQGLLKHQQTLVIVTAGSKQEWFETHKAEEIIIRPVTEGTLAFCGLSNIIYKIIYDVTSKTDLQRDKILDDVKGHAQLFRQGSGQSRHNTEHNIELKAEQNTKNSTKNNAKHTNNDSSRNASA